MHRLPSDRYRIAALYPKLFHRIYAPLTAGTFAAYAGMIVSRLSGGATRSLVCRRRSRLEPTVRVRRCDAGCLNSVRKTLKAQAVDKGEQSLLFPPRSGLSA
jgi:hypothetical protein